MRISCWNTGTSHAETAPEIISPNMPTFQSSSRVETTRESIFSTQTTSQSPHPTPTSETTKMSNVTFATQAYSNSSARPGKN